MLLGSLGCFLGGGDRADLVALHGSSFRNNMCREGSVGTGLLSVGKAAMPRRINDKLQMQLSAVTASQC
jgi:hypothetical protein